MMLPAEQIALWADKLRDISATSLMFPSTIYDCERSNKIQEIAMSMMAFATSTNLSQLQPLQANLFSLISQLASWSHHTCTSVFWTLPVPKFL